MVSFRHPTIKQKLIWISAIASTAALVLAASAFTAYYVLTFRGAAVRTLIVRAEMISLNSVSPLRFNDERSAQETLSALRADRNVIAAAIYSADGQPFATYVGEGRDPSVIVPTIDAGHPDLERFQGRRLHVYHRIVADGEPLGIVYLAYSLDELFASLSQYAAIGVVVLAVSVLSAVLFVSRVQRGFAEPIARLAETAKSVSRKKDYSLRVEPTTKRDELGELIDTFNEMLEQIQVRDSEVEAGRARLHELSEELEQRVVRRTAELEATNKELEAFTYSVSHDLRAPLRRIDGFANLLMEQNRGRLSEESQHFLNRVREGTRQMGQLIDDLLHLARLGRKELSVRPTALSSIVDSIAGTLQRETGGRAIAWRIGPLPLVECDPALMEVVFTNLLSNAVKYSRPRAEAIIEVGTVDQDGHSVIFVRDNGVGFSMKYADKLFGVFQRLHRAEEFEGTGVGLATVQRIIHKHRGSIWVDAEPDKGACFYFTIGAPAGHVRPPVREAVT